MFQKPQCGALENQEAPADMPFMKVLIQARPCLSAILRASDDAEGTCFLRLKDRVNHQIGPYTIA